MLNTNTNHNIRTKAANIRMDHDMNQNDISAAKILFKMRQHKKRLFSCNRCEACLMPDCGLCMNCKNKVKFGGNGSRKQRCIKRICTLI